ncbi:hypothetical protein MYCTH_2300958 [Thermothelomyces thermophilus ATCC 42464]|uniref:Protein farnesyltransferase/geranylgeranyltransferase type-1 subunit alpha n=1 Tax=Thermothelomyces thermophilus (strain ATCC 42464 / BCRC 31852 / DSM 1799) TaxID=573729 RepID=G2Q8J7_THET4|nr:uncharacterized protein MYCTH_2300958 [Thermothelomyces thermophilus ATCC 42464]AEO56246.1 hypothetical protein MYCTH_2300958 [Thermothelomyces thermophilus ATCC 42464]
MPPNAKVASKPKASETSKPPQSTTTGATPAASTSHTAPPTAINHPALPTQPGNPQTDHDRSQTRFSLSALSRADQVAWLAARIASRLAARPALSSGTTTTTTATATTAATVARLACGGGPKTLKEVWRVVNERSAPLRAPRPKGRKAVEEEDEEEEEKKKKKKEEKEGLRTGEDEARWERKVVLSCLAVQSCCFRARRERERQGQAEEKTGEAAVVTEQEVFEETRRRREMAALRKELYGGGVGKAGKLAADPEWDDVQPVVLEEPEGALAAIAYPADYAEAMAYLRAVMQAKEYSPRCLRLTEHIIAMNPAHYTVWLYRASIVFALQLPIPDEITWLNRVALENLKNYQIWHHRHLLVENYYPTIASDPSAVASFAASERSFLQRILAEDTKNYHVWSYRSYLVNKLDLFNDGDELASIEAMLDDDVRNNSAWSHRFFLVFSNPDYATPGSAATEADPGVPQAVVDREVEYAQDKIRLAPQNQSGWNYLRGVLVKGGRKLGSVEQFASEFVKGLGEGGEEGKEEVLSTHALDLLAEIYAEKGDKEKADLSLRRLGQKWDRIRVGYWEWRRKCLEATA